MYDEWGIAHGYHDVNGTWHDTSYETRELLRSAMHGTSFAERTAGSPLWFVEEGSTHGLNGRCHLALDDGTDRGDVDSLPGDLPIGYHQLIPLDGGPISTLVVAPSTCPPVPSGWGVAAQVYSLWRHDAWGIGDLRDVETLGQLVAAAGGTALLLSPLHAPASSIPQEPSPYYPSSRRWLNPLLIPMTTACPDGLSNESGGLIDRDRVWAAKRQALSQRFSEEGRSTEWRGWARAQGPDLWRFCTWNALADRHGAAWREWPAELCHPDSPAVNDLALHDSEFATTAEFHGWLQWLTNRDLRYTAAAAGLHLIGDLAVGCSPHGADAWLHQDLMALDVSIGAPPDPFNRDGQSWGLPPFVPWRLRAAGYAPFIGMVRASLNGMSGLRIDHVMGLFRQFWIPADHGPAEGAYVQLPADELLAIIRIEAVRAGAFVIGEDLGTVQPEVHDAMRSGGMSGTKVWWFDQHVAEWPTTSLGTVTTHDLPTIAGVWSGADGNDEMRAALHAAAPAATSALEAAVVLHQLIAASPAQLTLASIDDLAGLTDRPNHPGTGGDTHPNWRRRMETDVEHILTSDTGAAILHALQNQAEGS